MSATTLLVIQAQQKEKEHCLKFINEFEQSENLLNTDVGTKQAYAACVQRIYPEQEQGSFPVGQSAIGFILLSVVASIVVEYFRKTYIKDYVTAAAEGFLFSIICLIVLIAVAYVATAFI